MLITVTAPPQLRAGPGPGDAGTAAAVIRTDALTKRYPGDVTALAGLTVDIHPGITGLVGANGAGKSTLIKILLGLLPPTSGRAVVLGHNAAASGERIRTLTGYMPEHDCLPPDVTGTEFVTHLGRMSGLPATAAKERAAASGRAHDRAGPGRAQFHAGSDQQDRGRFRHLDRGLLAPARGDRTDLRPARRHRRGQAAALGHDDQLHQGKPGAADRGRRGHGRAPGGTGRPRAGAPALRARAAGADRRRCDLRHGQGCRRGPEPAAEPAGAAAAPGRGAVP